MGLTECNCHGLFTYLRSRRYKERRDQVIQIKRIDHPLIHERSRKEFGWTEFGYISASLYFLHKRDGLPSIHDGLGVAGDMIIDYGMNGGQANAFQNGWKHYLAEWKSAHATADHHGD